MINRVVVSNGVVYTIGTPSPITSLTNCPIAIWKSNDGTDYHLTSAQFACGGQIDATDRPGRCRHHDLGQRDGIYRERRHVVAASDRGDHPRPEPAGHGRGG